MGTLEINELTKIFSDTSGDIVAVDDFDATFEDGEFIVLVGPSGCGKSTTLRCIAGLESPTSGELVLDGQEITDRKPKERNMAMVFQSQNTVAWELLLTAATVTMIPVVVLFAFVQSYIVEGLASGGMKGA